MNWKGKLIGSILGYILGGPFGMIFGFIIGHLYDQGHFNQILESLGFTHRPASDAQQVFFNSTFSIMGYIAKSDGRVSEHEIQAARRVMENMGLTDALKHEAIALFNQGKQNDFDPTTTLSNLKRACWSHPSILRTFLEIQIQMAYVEGPLTAKKRDALQRVCASLGISGFNFSQFERQYRAEQNYRQHSQKPYQDPKQHLKEAYEVLGVSPSTSDADLKKAYRRLMSKNHPDRLIAKGMPPEMIKIAKQKTQQINNAYETIKKTRGMK